MYSENTNDYIVKYMPFMVEVTEEMRWDELVGQVDNIIDRLKEEVSPSRVGNSSIRLEIDESNHKKSNIASQVKEKLYTIRVIKNDHLYENNCFFCKN